ncbi:hypothetical protein JCM33374_g2505 [Metschnikowia sp. JCM 33374]|nr:hypothetical protein JCM33374_g2505 [Metschnikowia sp. JCM 33374]
MSAFAALRKQQDIHDYCYPHPLKGLLAGPVETSNFQFTIENSIFTPSSVIVGLLPSQYLVVHGVYQLTVIRGVCLANNTHEIPCGVSFPVITSSAESLPTIASPDHIQPTSEAQTNESKHHKNGKILPEFATVVELSNWDLGIEKIGLYNPSLANLYKNPGVGYTFDVLLDAKDASSTIYFDKYTLRALNSACRQMGAVVVFGVPNSGKKTFAKTLLNNMVLSDKQSVAYLDLDPASIDSDNPGCLSLRVIRQPILGEFSFWCSDNHNEDHIHRYYGFTSFAEKPRFYLNLCQDLLKHYRNELEPQGIPLVVKYPSWIKGYGKELLVEFSRSLNPKKIVYLTHNDALSLENFEPDAFEETDHPDLDVLSGFQSKDCSIVRGVRRARSFTKNDLLVRNKLLYFHKIPGVGFDFAKPLLENAPVKFSFDYVAGISVLDLDDDTNLTKKDLFGLVEATIMGIFIVKTLPEASKDLYLSGSVFSSLECSYIGLCMVHSVNVSESAFNIYLRDEIYVSEQIQHAQNRGYSVVLARGEGQIPSVELTNGITSNDIRLPYVSFDPMQKLGGIWKVRRNIGRKNQG